LEINDHCGHFQPSPFYDSMIRTRGDFLMIIETRLTNLDCLRSNKLYNKDQYVLG